MLSLSAAQPTGDCTSTPCSSVPVTCSVSACLAPLQQLKLTHICTQTGQKGVRIRRVDPTAPCSQHMQTGDILLSFDGIKIANDGALQLCLQCIRLEASLLDVRALLGLSSLSLFTARRLCGAADTAITEALVLG